MSTESPLPTEVKQRNFRHLVYDIGWFGLAIPATTRFLSVYAIRLDASPLVLGLLTSLPAIVLMLTSMLAGWWRRRYTTTVDAQFWPGLGFRLVFLLPALTPIFPHAWQPYWLLLCVTLPAIPQGVSSVIFLVLMREAVDKSTLTALTSRRSLVFNVAFGLSTLAFGFWLQEEFVRFPANYQIMYLAAFIMSLISMMHVQRVRSVHVETPVQTDQPSVRPWRVPALQRVLFIIVITHLAFFILAPIITLYLVEDLGADEGFVSLYGVAELAAAAAAAIFTDRLLQRYGNRAVIAWAMVATAGAALILALATSLPITLVSAALSGVAWSAAAISVFGYFSDVTPHEQLTSYLTVYNQIVSLSVFVAPLIGSQMAESRLGLSEILVIGAVLRIIAAGLIPFNPFERAKRVRKPVSVV